MDAYRDPCPYRIFSDAGVAFSMGAIGGFIKEMYVGSKNAPTFTNKFVSGFRKVHRDASKIGGSFAMWGITFSAVDCSLVAIRQKEDPFNSIIAGGMTGAFLAVRNGYKQMLAQGMVGAVLLSVIEGIGIAFQHFLTPAIIQEQLSEPDNSHKALI